MATVIDISNKIKNEEKFITYNGKNYKVNDTKNNVLEAMELIDKSSGARVMEELVEKMLGKKALKEIEDLNLNMDDYKVIYIAIMACISGETYEKAEERFHARTADES